MKNRCHEKRQLHFEPLEARVVLSSDSLVISEFMAANGSTLADGDGQFPDWIEIRNLGETAAELGNYALTDDDGNLQKWRFPAGAIDPGEYRIVFASAPRDTTGNPLDDYVDPSGNAHTNFKLSASGEYLALTYEDPITHAVSIVSQFAPEFPSQHRDISYGISQIHSDLVQEGDLVRFTIPTDSSLGSNWISPDFNDTTWSSGTLGVGYETDPGSGGGPGLELTNLAPSGTATQSSLLSSFTPDLGIDGNYGNFTHTLANANLPAWWQVDLGDSFALEQIVLHNRDSCCQARLRDITVEVLDAEGNPVFTSALLNPENVDSGPETIELNLPTLGGGELIAGQTVHVIRTPDPDLSGTGGVGSDSDANVLSLGEVEVFGREIVGYDQVFETDLEAALLDQNATVYLRTPVTLTDDPATISQLLLRVQYDDGFIAYLNGTQIAARNAPSNPTFDSSATAERADLDALQFEAIDISQYTHLLQQGDNVLAIQGLNLNAGDDDFLLVPQLVAISDSTEHRYFSIPTPGQPNPRGLTGFVADTTASVDRGFFDSPITVDITTPTAGATLVYTTDGSEPSLSNGSQVLPPDANTAPWTSVVLSTTTVLRTAAFKNNYIPTDVGTRTYLFIDDVITSGVMDTAITQDPTYAPLMEQSLTELPSISLVFADPIITKQDRDEQKVSIEWIDPDSADGFQVDAGVSQYGGYYTNFAKKNFRIYFRSEYGTPRLEFPLFDGYDRGLPAADSFDQINFRSGSHDMSQRGFYMSNRFTDDTMLDMGHLAPHGRFVHMYVNGVYWGQFHLRERWNADMLSQYFGGDKDDYEAINGNLNVGGWSPGKPYDGDGSGWEAIKSMAGDYEAIRQHLDVTNYIDYMLLYMAGRSENEYRTGGTPDGSVPYVFFLNDADGWLRSTSDRTDNVGPGDILSGLIAEGHPDFEMLLADRIQKLFFNDGVLTPEKSVARLQERLDQVELSFIAESARWGYRTPASWESAATNAIENLLPAITPNMIDRLRARGMIFNVDAPAFSQQGGQVPDGFALDVSASSGLIYYTLDGSDPRMLGGQPNPDALVFDTHNQVSVSNLIPTGAAWRYLDNGTNQDTAWRGSGFDDTSWASGNAQLGYGDGDEQTVVSYGPNAQNKYTTTYFRHTFNATNVADVSSLTLRLQRDDGAVVYLNGTEVTRSNMPTGTISYTTLAGGDTGGESTFHEIAIAPAWLVEGDNVIAVEVHQRSLNSSDISFDLELTSRTGDGQGDILTLPITATTQLKARAWAGNEWSALNEATFLVDAPAKAGNIAITELNYNPYDPLLQFGEPAVDSDLFEFVELTNTSGNPVNLLGARFAEGITFTFGDKTLQPGERTLVVHDLASFESRYGTGPNVAGEFEGKLSNGGEQITLLDASGTEIQSFQYNDTGSWPGRADGTGSTLEVIDTMASYDSAANWRSSNEFGGSPATAGTGPQFDVIVNEVFSHSDGLLTDKVELYNKTSSPINLQGWHLSDKASNLFLYTFGAEATIDEGEYLVLDENQLGFALDGQLGDDIWLVQGAANGKPIRFADHEKFDATDSHTTLGRWPDGDPTASLFPLAVPTLGNVNSGPLFGDLLITEIHFNPDSVPPSQQANISQGELEFVELLNNRDSTLNISNWKIEGIDWTFPAGTSLAGGETIVVVPFDPNAEPVKQAAFRNILNVAPSVRLFGAAAGQLDNGGERISVLRPEDGVLLDSGDILVDSVRFDDSAPWPIEADGSGKSLTRTARTDFAPQASSWVAAIPSPGSVTVTALVSGDYDRNGVVEQTDYVLWKTSYGARANPAGNDNRPAADGNSDGVVDQADFTLWRDHLGQSVVSAAVVADTGVLESSVVVGRIATPRIALPVQMTPESTAGPMPSFSVVSDLDTVHGEADTRNLGDRVGLSLASYLAQAQPYGPRRVLKSSESSHVRGRYTVRDVALSQYIQESIHRRDLDGTDLHVAFFPR